jgi:ABC-type nickel/cobalt efflux system permease component RcnA
MTFCTLCPCFHIDGLPKTAPIKSVCRRAALLLLNLAATALTLAYYLLLSPILLWAWLQNARWSNHTRAVLEVAGKLLVAGLACWGFNRLRN